METNASSQVGLFDAGRILIQESWSPERNQRCSSSSSVGNYSTPSLNGTPSNASSEASSNSHKGLIMNRPKPVSIHLSDRKQGKGRRKSTASDSIKWLFRQRCLCSGKKCVQVKQEVLVLSHNKLKFPPLSADEMYPRNQIVDHKMTQRAKQRAQIIVQNSTRQRLISLPIFSNPATTDDDVASNASSDLFEIQSFSTHTTYFPPDESQTDMIYYEQMTPSIEYCYYEPSEADIGWSITTSEGFDLDRPSMSTFHISDHQVEERQCQSDYVSLRDK
ncbi:hypothetical protein DCAR_0519316 [Daucus carota subsp. sativus]|uniref:Uncharacterized protein n=1 Tax=Daucus carota subsp. sativus TaxID=79200 RepID=A0A164XVY7_DAUCS|nr:hypothetical protein DCAR_0519316 [Daucus carota subsp. sativus]